jgi:hypothetical protein
MAENIFKLTEELSIKDELKTKIGRVNILLELDDAILLLRYIQGIDGSDKKDFESLCFELHKSIISRINNIKV